MCQIVSPRCCHCGLAQQTFPIVCKFFMLLARHAVRYNQPHWMPDPRRCHYAKKVQKPVLSGCRNNHPSMSRFDTMLVRFGDIETEQSRRVREFAARKLFERYKKTFADQYFAKTVPPPREKPVPFLIAAVRVVEVTSETDLETDSDEDGIEIPRGRKFTWGERNSRARAAARTNATLRYARNHPSGTTLASGIPSRITLATRNSSGSLSDGDNVPPADLLVDVVPENGYQGRPRRMVEFSGLDSTMALTRGNPLITCYGRAAPRTAPDFVTRVEICSQPQGKATKILEGVIDKDGATKSPSGFARMVEFSGLNSTMALTRGNPLITCYARAAPRTAPDFVTRVEVCSQPQGKAAILLEGVVDRGGATESPSGFARAVGMIRDLFSAGL
ncbi:hypothetical protein AUP68_03226 [Ilyonectria robusta]